MEYFDCPLNGEDLVADVLLDEIFDGGMYLEHPREQRCYVGYIGDVVCEVRYEKDSNELRVKATWRPIKNVAKKLDEFIASFNKEEENNKLKATLFRSTESCYCFSIVFEYWEEDEEY